MRREGKRRRGGAPVSGGDDRTTARRRRRSGTWMIGKISLPTRASKKPTLPTPATFFSLDAWSVSCNRSVVFVMVLCRL